METNAGKFLTQPVLWLSSVFSWANLVPLMKSDVFLEIDIVISTLLVMRLCTHVLAAPPLKPSKSSYLTSFNIGSSGNTRMRGGIALVLTALAAMQWSAPQLACAAPPQSAPINTLESARQSPAQAPAGVSNSSEPAQSLDPILAEASSLRRLSKSSDVRSDSLIWTMIGSGPFARITKADADKGKRRMANTKQLLRSF